MNLPITENELNIIIKILKNHDCKVAVVGVYKETGNSFNNCTNYCGETKSLKELVQIYNQASVLVTADSGPAHIAALANLPVVVLFGPEAAIRFRPLAENVDVITSNLHCSPCLSAYNHRNSSCINNLCMQNITVEQVYEKVCNYI